MDTLTLVQSGCIFAASGAFFWWLGGALTKAKMQPMLDAQLRMTKMAEDKFHHASQASKEIAKQAEAAQEELKNQHDKALAEVSAKHVDLEKQKAAVEQLRLSDAAAMNALRDDATSAMNTLRDEAAAKVINLMQQMAALEKTLGDKDNRIVLAETQTEPLQQRIADLTQTLTAEREKHAALQTAIDAKQATLDAKEDIAQQLKQQLTATIQAIETEKRATAEREAKFKASLSEYEQWQAAGKSQTEVFGAEMDQLKATLAQTETDSEAKQTELKRRLAQSDTKIQMLQKEIMTIVGSGAGGASDAAAVATMAEDLAQAQERARAAERKIVELESRGAVPDSDLRKRLRESEYRACELEVKLSEAEEACEKAMLQLAAASSTKAQA
jgi:DNA repair exonuclease SbcCD ATPase subunit